MDRGMDIAMGIIALLAVPWLFWTMRRGLGSGRLPIARSYVDRSERPGAFHFMLALYLVILIGIAVVAADLLLGLNLKGPR